MVGSAAGGNPTITGGKHALQSTSNEFVVSLNSHSLTIATPLQDFTGGSTSTSLTLGGNATLILTAANTYSGATTILAGTTLNIGNGLATGSINNTSAIANYGTLTINSTGKPTSCR